MQISQSRLQSIPPRTPAAQALDDRREESAELPRKLAIVSFIRLVLVTLALGALLVLTELRIPRDTDALASWQYILIGVAYGLSIVYAVALRYHFAVRQLAYGQIVVDTVIATVLVVMTGGIESVFAFVYVFTVLGAGMTLYRRGAMVASLAYFLCFGTIVLLQIDLHFSLLPVVPFGRAMFSFFMHSVGIALVAVLSSALAEKVKITGRRLAEKQIDYERLEELHAAILRSLPAGLMTVDASGTVRYANEAALAILKREPDDTVGRALMEVVPSMAHEWNRRRPSTGPGREGARERFEASFRRGDGRTIRLGFSFAPLGQQSGLGSIAVFQDVTEIVRLKDAYERAERLASVGKIAAGLAHEVRNPLASMCASIDVLKQAINPPEPMKRLMSNVVKEADRLNALITDFLAFARPRAPNRKRTELSAVVTGVVDIFKNDQKLSSCELDIQLESGLFAQIDADQIRQVLWNLARNAAEAMKSAPEGPNRRNVLTIRTRARGATVEIAIHDTGPGISPEHMKRIFDPFYTTKEGGSGLGLAISHSIVEAHGGRILVESKPGEGTEVTITLSADLELANWAERDTTELPEWGEGSSPSSTSDMDILGGSGPQAKDVSRQS